MVFISEMSHVLKDEPIHLKRLRNHFETLSGGDFTPDFIPDNLQIIGLLMGHRQLYSTDEFSEYSMDISQGCNEELRIRYVGKTSI